MDVGDWKFLKKHRDGSAEVESGRRELPLGAAWSLLYQHINTDTSEAEQ